MSENEAKTSLKRSSNFELLRILAMLMSVASHAAQHSGNGEWVVMSLPFSLNLFATYLLKIHVRRFCADAPPFKDTHLWNRIQT